MIPRATASATTRPVTARDACALLAERTRRSGAPLVAVSLPGRALRLGADQPGPPATLVTCGAAMMKMFAGRPVEPSEYRLSGAAAAELSVF
jgi:hypothetical protein